MHFANGNNYHGSWKDGKFDGQGEFQWSNSSKAYKGIVHIIQALTSME